MSPPAFRRLLVIGPGGAGKSTLAAQVAQRTGLPLVHLDAHFWRSGWRATPDDEWTQRVYALLVGEAWVMDGHFGGTLERRLAACDAVVYLDLSPWRCLWRVLQRRLRHRARPRPDMAPGCNERLDLSFAGWILGFRRTRRPKLLARLEAARARGVQVFVLDTPASVAAWLAALGQAGGGYLAPRAGAR